MSDGAIEYKKEARIRNRTNVVDLIKQARLEESKEKKHTLYVVAATASVIAITGIVIAL